MPSLLTGDDLPMNFVYPAEFVRLVECGLLNLEPWYVLTDDLLRRQAAGLRKRYPSRALIPFAARQDNDDVACWEGETPGRVVVVHDFADSGWESQGEFLDFTAWLRNAFNDFIEWVS